jgi:pilus assembly protein CpaE
MMEATHSSGDLYVALLTIKVEKAAVEELRGCAAAMPWRMVDADFDHYFSSAKRPYFSQKIIDAQACIAVIDFDDDPALAFETAEFLRRSFYQKLAVVAFSSGADPETALHAMRAGCSEYLKKPLNHNEFLDTLTRLDHRWAAMVSHPLNAGKVLSFFGAKGGVGTTTLALHLAMFLVKDFKKKVLLIDNRAQLGHVALYLGIDGASHTFHELVMNVSRLDQELLSGFIAKHDSGLDILSSPDVYGGARNTDSAAVEQTVEFLSSQYDFVLLDSDASFEDINLAIIDLSNIVYLIATPAIGAIRDLSRYVDGLIQNEHATDKLQVIINRYSSREAITIEQIEKAVRLPIAFKIVNSYFELVRAINTGKPVASESNSDFSDSVMKWAVGLIGANEPPPQQPIKKWFALW